MLCGIGLALSNGLQIDTESANSIAFDLKTIQNDTHMTEPQLSFKSILRLIGVER